MEEKNIEKIEKNIYYTTRFTIYLWNSNSYDGMASFLWIPRKIWW